MFKQKVENKEQKPSVFVGTFSGRQIPREQVEDPQRPGHARASLFPAEPDVWNALGFYRLLANGKQTWPVEQAPDPLRPRPDEAPAKLREALALAEKCYSEAVAKYSAAVEARAVAEDESRAAARAENRKKYDAAVATSARLLEEVRDADMAIAAPRVAYCRAQENMHTWLRLEANTRCRQP